MAALVEVEEVRLALPPPAMDRQTQVAVVVVLNKVARQEAQAALAL
jgi:hypothetical protein